MVQDTWFVVQDTGFVVQELPGVRARKLLTDPPPDSPESSPDSRGSSPAPAPLLQLQSDRIIIGLMTSDRKLKAFRGGLRSEGSSGPKGLYQWQKLTAESTLSSSHL